MLTPEKLAGDLVRLTRERDAERAARLRVEHELRLLRERLQ